MSEKPDQTIVTLIEHTGGHSEDRYYCNSHRISRARYEMLREAATRMDCFFTSGKQVGGTIRRVNYVNVWLPDGVTTQEERRHA